MNLQETNLGETHPSSVPEIARKIVLEPISPAVYNLDYACLLDPASAHHHLTGDLSDQISDWVPQICVAFGWRLEYISVRPEYLLWIANVPPATSPGYLMRILRQHSSEKIFAEFPRFQERESLRRFLGSRLPHHGWIAAASRPIDQGFHLPDAPAPGICSLNPLIPLEAVFHAPYSLPH